VKIERGDVLLVEFDPPVGSEIKKTRPVILVANDVANTYSRVVVVVPLASQKIDTVFPHEVLIKNTKGLSKVSKANVSQLRAVDRLRIKSKLGEISTKELSLLDAALKLHLGLS
jgi:mRNA interferase MazF